MCSPVGERTTEICISTVNIWKINKRGKKVYDTDNRLLVQSCFFRTSPLLPVFPPPFFFKSKQLDVSIGWKTRNKSFWLLLIVLISLLCVPKPHFLLLSSQWNFSCSDQSGCVGSYPLWMVESTVVLCTEGTWKFGLKPSNSQATWSGENRSISSLKTRQILSNQVNLPCWLVVLQWRVGPGCGKDFGCSDFHWKTDILPSQRRKWQEMSARIGDSCFSG